MASQATDMYADILQVTEPSHATILSEAVEALYALPLLRLSGCMGFHAYLDGCSGSGAPLTAQLTAHALMCLLCHTHETLVSGGHAKQTPNAVKGAGYLYQEAGNLFLERMYNTFHRTIEVTAILTAKPNIATCTIALHWL